MTWVQQMLMAEEAIRHFHLSYPGEISRSNRGR